jgi:hypothetical protein
MLDIITPTIYTARSGVIEAKDMMHSINVTALQLMTPVNSSDSSVLHHAGCIASVETHIVL